MTQTDLHQARQQIDALDENIQSLISQRARIAQGIALIKQGMGDTGDHYRPSREAEVLRTVMARNRANGGPLTDETMARLMREIMSACLSLESPLTIAYLGPEGTYTQEAVLKHFGDSVRARANGTIGEIFRDVEAGAADYGVVPVENSIGGVVSHTLDELVHTKLRICGEVSLPVHHQLLSCAEALEDVVKIYAHPQSFLQCRQWLDARLPDAVRESVSSNGRAAALAREQGGHVAAIASVQAGKINGLNILASSIEDDPSNTTRFLILGKQAPAETGDDLTSLVLTGHRNQPGSLLKLLQPLSDAGLNMSRIESRPVKGSAAQDYYFFIDFAGHAAQEKVRQALDAVGRTAAFFKVLGSYPRAVV
ncbi:prephenate dehydratase [Sinimarinibacterium sp. NLF-5-8]|uniref:prephenate dehydratase n=1 Tax=Sinimarinibacterium sp. NLF-5-8 TaxID=2698684 RepID=UPI00137BF19C|nr:prephenate dehydratase [Sinimarinibacterium sp. NLF-5-8]QHS09629.1 prephenate dehydratase [Sinimarinibacterium sp. NLF-5-8]